MNKHIKALATAPVHPDRAVGYFAGSGKRNWEPALVWLLIAVIGLNVIRTGTLPNGKQSVTWLGLSAGVVVLGAFVPEIVAVVLVGLLIAGALNVSAPLTNAINGATAKVGAAFGQ